MHKKGKQASKKPSIYWLRCFLIKLQLLITIVLVRVKLIKRKNNKKQKKTFNITKIYKTITKNFNLTCIMHIKIRLRLSIFLFFYVKIHNWAYIEILRRLFVFSMT